MPRNILTAGDRVYLKFFDMDYFQSRACEADARIVQCRDLDEGRFGELLPDADALIVIDRPVTAAHMELMQRCRIILALEVGYDFIDLEAATRQGIIVSNVPAYCTQQVALHALTLLLAGSRNLKVLMNETRSGGWSYRAGAPMFDLQGSTLGIIGLGRIGRALVPMARGLDLHIAAYDPYLADDVFGLLDVQRCYELGDLLDISDYMSMHVPLNDETFHMIGAKELGRMKQHAFLVNTCRGKVIDTAALAEALREKTIAGCGLDVLEKEPPDASEPLLDMPNAVVTPHVAWYSEGAVRRLKEQGMDEVVRVLGGKRPRFVVNPDVLGNRQADQEGLGRKG
jgi:D-3-phosphoglycerate dehydrogenase